MNTFKKITWVWHLRNGQSIIEALVALSILMTALIGIMTLLTQSFFLNRVVSDQTKATYLAAEGVEVAKSLIDHDVYENLAAGGEGNGGWGACFAPSAGTPPTTHDYQMDYTTVNCDTLQNFDSAVPLRFDPFTGIYSYTGPDVTDFVRDVRIIEPNTNEIDVESIVTWGTGSIKNQSIVLEEHFYHWHP